MSNRQTLELLTILRDEDCPTIDTLRRKFTLEVDEIIDELRARSIITIILTDGTIYNVDKNLLNEYINYTKSQIGVIPHLKRNYKVYMEGVTVFLAILGFIIGCM